MNKWDGFDLAYAAGLVDGEGTIRIDRLPVRGTRRTADQLLIRVAVGNTDPRMPSASAAQFLSLIRNRLIIKAAQAEVALALQRTMGRRGAHVPAEVRLHRELLVVQMRDLNRKGA